jgi:titin
LQLQSLFYSKNQIRQEIEETAASMVVVATAKSTKLETALGAQEEIAIQQGQMHLTHDQVMTSC